MRPERFPPRLSSERLELVVTEIEHAEALFGIYGDAPSVRFYPREPCKSLDECRRVVERMIAVREDGQGARWSILRKDSGALIGSLGFHAWDRIERSASLSYELVPEARGRGYALEASRAVVDFGFSILDLGKVEAEVHRENLPSLSLLDRLGFVRSRELHREWQGQEMVFYGFELLRPES